MMAKQRGRAGFIPTVIAVLVSVFAATVGHAAPAGSPQLSMVIIKGEDAIVGEVLSDTDGEIKVNDIKAGRERTVLKSKVTEVRKDLSDGVAIASSDLESVMAWKASRLSSSNAVVGKIAKNSDNIVYCTLGSNDRLAKGQTLNVFRNAGDIVDPETKKVIGRDRPRIAQLEVVEVQETFSKAKLAGDLEVKLAVGDEVETIPKRAVVAVLPLVDSGGNETEAGKALAEHLTGSLVEKRVAVVERTMLDDAIRELALQRTGLFERDSVQKLGKQIGASMLLTGKILPDGKVNRAFVRMFNVETGEVVLTSSQIVRGSNVVSPASPTARGSGDAGKSAGGDASASAKPGPAGPPPDEKVIAEDKHAGIVTNHPSFTKANTYVLKIDAKDPLIRIAQTNLFYQGFQPDDLANTKGNITLSIDYGKTWINVAKWDTEEMKRAKRRDHWHVIPLAPAFKKKPATEVDEIQVKFDVDGIVEQIRVETVIWAKQ